MNLSDLIDEFVSVQHDMSNYLTALIIFLEDPEREMTEEERGMAAVGVMQLRNALINW